jgi:hypothetical protein
MAASIGDANEEDDDGSSHGALGSVVEHEYCAMAGLRGATHRDGDGEPSSDTHRSAAESATDCENCAAASLGCGTGAHGDDNSKPSSGAATDTSPASQP